MMTTNFSKHKDQFEAIYYAFHRKIYGYAFQKTHSTYIAEETVQRTFIKLWNNLEHKGVDIDINAQLFCISRSVLLDILKEENKRRLLITTDFNPLETQNPFELIKIKDLENKIYHIVDAMPVVRQKIFKMSRFENLKHKEIANLLNISSKTVENHIRLALKTLKSALTTLVILFFYFFH